MFVRMFNPSSPSTRANQNQSHFLVYPNQTFSDSFVKFFLITNFAIIPVVSLLGISGNVVSMLILYKHGLKKCSNVLIFALAVADTAYLVGINNFPLFIYDAHVGVFGFFYSETTSMLLYVLYQALVFLETIGKVVSLLMPVFIVLERFFVVFWPLHVSRLLTARRVKTIAILLYAVGIPPYVFFTRTQKYVYNRDPATNTSFGLMFLTPNSDSYVFNWVSEVYTTLCGPVSVAIVVFGVTLVGVKIHLQIKHRRKSMTQSAATSNNNFDLHDVDFKCSKFCGKIRTESYKLSRISSPKFESKKEFYLCSSKKVTCLYSLNNSNITDITLKDGEIPPATLHPVDNVRPTSEVREHSVHNRTLKNNLPVNAALLEAKRGIRTTKILLSVCVVYSLTASLSFISDTFLNADNIGFKMWVILHRSGMTAICINSTANFLIYVGLNRNFRETYKQLFCQCLHKTRQ